MRWAAAAPVCYPPKVSVSATSNRCCRSAFHSDQQLLPMISTKSSRTNDGSKYSSTSALTFPKVLCGRCLLPSLNARSIRRLQSGRGWGRRVGDRPDWRSGHRSQSRTRSCGRTRTSAHSNVVHRHSFSWWLKFVEGVGLFVVGVEGQEGQSGGGAGDDLRQQIHP